MANSYLDKTGLAHFWDSIKGKFVKKSGDSMTGRLEFNVTNSGILFTTGNTKGIEGATSPQTGAGVTSITNIRKPVNDYDVANKIYVDNLKTDFVTAFGEIGVEGTTTAYGDITAQKLSNGKYNLYIEFGIGKVTTSSGFNVLSTSKIASLLGFTSLTLTSWRETQLSIWDAKTGNNLAINTSAYGNPAGYVGFHLISGSAGDLQVCRTYNTSGSGGGWAISSYAKSDSSYRFFGQATLLNVNLTK